MAKIEGSVELKPSEVVKLRRLLKAYKKVLQLEEMLLKADACVDAKEKRNYYNTVLQEKAKLFKKRTQYQKDIETLLFNLKSKQHALPLAPRTK